MNSQLSGLRGIAPRLVATTLTGVLAALISGTPASGFAQSPQKRVPGPTGILDGAQSSSDVATVATETPVRVVWKRVPLPVGLQVGKERMISFPAPVRLGIPPEVAPFVRAQLVDKTAYIIASAPFTKARVVAENPVNGTVILLDITASKSLTATAPFEIFNDKKPDGEAVANRRPDIDDQERAEEVDMVMLTRYAVQQLYAPRRLIAELPGVRQVQLNPSAVPALYRGVNVKAEPVGSWKSPEHYVTAVKLTNTGTSAIELDPRNLRGEWRAATFQHSRILRAGNEEDTTVVYLISDRRFEEAQ